MANVTEQEKTSEVQEKMKIMQQLGTPGMQHKQLAKLAGTWKSKMKSWMEPGKAPIESAGTNVQEMILDGRYLQSTETGLMGGAPFTGIGVTGFNNATKKFFETWMDSMSTGVALFEGTSSADGKTMTMESHMDHPAMGPVTMRTVTKLLDDDHYTFEMFNTDKSGKEQKTMEITYSRVK